MTSIFDAYETDKTKELEGVPFKKGNLGTFIIARAGGQNMAFIKAVEEKTRGLREEISSEELDPEVGNKLLIEAFAEGIVLGWKGIKTREGKVLKFSKPAVVDLLTRLPDLFVEIREFAQNRANYLVTEIEADLGN